MMTNKNDCIDSNAVIEYDISMLYQERPKATLTIRNLDPMIKERLRIRAAEHGCSMEAEVRAIVTSAVEIKPPQEINLAEAIRRRFAPFGGVDLELPPRDLVRDPPSFEP